MSSMTENNTDNPTVVTPQEFLPAISSFFENLSESQRNLIEDGSCDSDVQALLVDMICEIIQIAAARILRFALPQIQSQILRGESPEDVMATINTSLGDSVSASIASALDVVQETCVSAAELTHMIEEVVADKISMAVSLLAESPDWPSEPSIYISGRIGNIKKLCEMVSCAAACIRRYIRKLKHSCMGREDQSSPSDESTVSTITVKSATSEVSSILSRWSTDTNMVGDDASDDEDEGSGSDGSESDASEPDDSDLALGDIQNYITVAWTLTHEEKDTESDALEQRGRGSAAPSPSRPASASSTSVHSVSLVKSSARSSHSVNRELDQTIKADLGSRALGDIQNYITVAWTLTKEEKDTESDGSEPDDSDSDDSYSDYSDSDDSDSDDSDSDNLKQSSRGSAAPSPSRPASASNAAVYDLCLVKSSARSSHSVSELMPECTSQETRSESKLASLPGASKGDIRQPSLSKKSELGLSQVSVSSFDPERISKNLISYLLVWIIVKSKKQQLLTSPETNMVINRLQDLVKQNISNIESARNLEDTMQQFTKSLSKRLIKEFGSPDKVLTAAMANDPSFNEALLRNLKLDLGVFPSPPPKKSKAARFFSAVGKAFLKPFRCCCKGSDDSIPV